MDINFRRMVINYEMLRKAADLAYQSLLDNAHKILTNSSTVTLASTPLKMTTLTG